MNTFFLSTGRKVFWRLDTTKNSKPIEIRYGKLPDDLLITNEERVEAARKINQILHPEQEINHAA